MLLHGALDYADQLLRFRFSNEGVLWRIIAWIKFCGARHMVNSVSKLANKRLNFVMKRLIDIPLESTIKARKLFSSLFLISMKIMKIIRNLDIL